MKDTYNLLADGIVLVLRALAQQAAEAVAPWAERAGWGRYVTGTSLKGQAELEWDDPQARRRFLQEIVADAERVLERVRQRRGELGADRPGDARLVEAAGLLSRVLLQDIERRDDGPALKEGVAKDRMPTVPDPELRHGRKSKAKRCDGHKAEIAVDTESQLITAVEVLAGNAPDHEGALQLVEATEAATGCAVAATLGDCAFGDGATRQAFADADRVLIAKVPALTNGGRFPKTSFVLDLDAGTCICPAQPVSTDLRPAGQGARVFRFVAAVCRACPLRAQCVRGRGGRSVQVHPQEALLQAARRRQASSAFPAYRAQRQVVEHRLARLVQLGLRQARYVGRTKTRFQLLMAAGVANFTLLATRAGLDVVLGGFALVVRVLAWRHPACPEAAAQVVPVLIDWAGERRPRRFPAVPRTLQMAALRPDF